MRKIILICVGTLKEKYWSDAFEEYKKRINKFFDFEIIEIPEYKLTDKPNENNIKKVLINEGIKIKEKIKNDNICSLCIEGKQLDSIEFAKYIEKNTNNNPLYFVIGGSFGIDNSIKNKSFNLSFGKITYPHQLMRILFVEQIYRAGTIINHIEYHK